MVPHPHQILVLECEVCCSCNEEQWRSFNLNQAQYKGDPHVFSKNDPHYPCSSSMFLPIFQSGVAVELLDCSLIYMRTASVVGTGHLVPVSRSVTMISPDCLDGVTAICCVPPHFSSLINDGCPYICHSSSSRPGQANLPDKSPATTALKMSLES